MTTLNRTQAPAFQSIKDITFIEPSTEMLSNEQTIHCINVGNQELIRLEFIFSNSVWDEHNPLAGMAVNHLLNEGTSRYSAEELAEKIDYYGAFFQTDFNVDYSSITLYTLNKHLKQVLPVFFDILTDADFPERELKTFIENQQQRLRVNLEKNDFVARRKFNKALFGHSVYGFESQCEDYEQLNRSVLQMYYREVYRPDNCTILLAGKVDQGVLDVINDFMPWKKVYHNPIKINAVATSSSLDKSIFIEKEDVLQSAIRLGMPFVNRNHPDFSALQILNTVLGGYFGSRLMKNVREDKGYTYGIGSAIVSLKHAGYFFIASEVGANVCSSAIDEIYKEIELLKTTLIDKNELNLVRNYLLGSILGSLENAFSHADKFKNIYLNGLTYDYYRNHIKTIHTISAEHLQSLAQRYWNRTDFYEVVVGKKIIM